MGRALACLVVLLAPAAAAAHQGSVVHASVDVGARGAAVALMLSPRELAELGGAPDAPALDAATVAARHDAILATVAAGLTLADGDVACRATPRALDAAPPLWIARVDYDCGRLVTALCLRDDLFFDGDPRHQAFVTLSVDGAPAGERVVTAGRRVVRVDRAPATWRWLADYLRLGVIHILTGWDHIAFLLALLLAGWSRGRRPALRPLLTLVTTFTVAHALSLLGVALGLVHLHPRIVEPLIALSIAWVAAANLAGARPALRWRETLVFGLVHGLGFASALASFGRPRHPYLCLFAFNAGIELAQLGLIAVALVALAALARLAAVDARRVGSAALLAAAGYWLVVRLWPGAGA